MEEGASAPKRTVVPAVSAPIAVEEPVSKETLSAVAAAAANMDAREDESDEELDEENAESGDGANAEAADADEDDELDMEEDDTDKLSVFKGKSVVVGRETPFLELEFVLRAAGASKVTREDDLLDIDAPDRLDGYTHWIVDRPSVRGPRNMSMEYVQPQYVFDSVNTGILLPPSLYGPGSKLPPHLSPFAAEDADGGYRPWFKDVLDRIKAGDESVVAEAAAVVYAQDKTEKESLREIEEAAAEHAVKTGAETGDKTGSKKRKKSKRRRGKKNAKGDKGTAGDHMSAVTAATEEEQAPDEEVSDEEAGDVDAEASEVSGDAEMEESSEEDDDEDEEMNAEEARKADEKSDKELAKIMMSRKKMRKYKHVIREEKQGEERKQKLTAKRRAIEMSGQSTAGKKVRRQAK